MNNAPEPTVEPKNPVSLESLDRRLDDLVDLFRRRLTEDRTRMAALQELRARAEFAEYGLETTVITPLVLGIARVIDRIDTVIDSGHLDDYANFVMSVAEDLIDALQMIDVAEVSANAEFDASRHNAVELIGNEGAQRMIEAVRRRGFHRAGRIIRPADVIVRRHDAGSPDHEGHSTNSATPYIEWTPNQT